MMRNRILFCLRQSDSDAPVTLERFIFWLSVGVSTLPVGRFELYRHNHKVAPDGPFPLTYLDSTGFLGHLYSSAFGPFWLLFTVSLIVPFHWNCLKGSREFFIWTMLFAISGADFCNKWDTGTNLLAGLSGTMVGIPIALWLNHRMIASDIWIGRILVLPCFLWPIILGILGLHYPHFERLLDNWIDGCDLLSGIRFS